MEAWLAHRSLATLQLRVDRQCANALTLAEALATRDDVTGLRYPGLPDDPSHEVAAGQMRRFGSVVSFVLADRERAERFLEALRLVDDATSFGGVRSTAERRGRWGGDAVPPGFVRFSVGAEDPDDLVADGSARTGTAVWNGRSEPPPSWLGPSCLCARIRSEPG
jgi:cystathionine gamma-lyase